MLRKKESFNYDWKFKLGDLTGAESPNFNDEDWRLLDIPHDWSIEGEFDKNHPTGGDGAYLPAGTGWYRKHFEKPKGPVALLEFDGVFQNCDVWLNGTHIGHNNFGYMGFEIDITPFLNDGENILAVRVDNSQQPNSRWYTGSGIYRNVWITQANKTRVCHWGVFVSTPKVGEEIAEVKVEAELTQSSEISLSVLDSKGKTLAEQSFPSAYKHVHRLAVPKPELWSVNSPTLYTLKTKVFENGEAVDEVLTPFGIRDIKFDKDGGFSINGVHTKINGVCVHHDGGSVGAAVPETVWERRLKKLKEMGCNGIRMSHNPPAPELLDLCDRMGFLVMDEAFDEWLIIKRKSENDNVTYGYGQFFEQDSEKDMASMVRRDRNHPSIVIWSIGNEIPEQGAQDGWLMARKLQELCHIEDPTRLVTLACDNIKADYNRTKDEFLKTLDVIGINYVNRWHIHAETAYAWERHKYPDKIIIGTEHSSVSGIRGQYNLEPEPGKWWSFPYFNTMIRQEHLLKQTMANDFVCGDFMWTGVDYLGESRWPNKNAACGVIDMCGYPKDGYYLYQSQWTDKPMLHIFPHWNWKGMEGKVLPVICYTNCDTVELIVNGKSYGIKAYEFPRQGMSESYGHFDLPHVPTTTNDLHLSWDIPYEPGTIKAIGRDRYGKVMLEEELKTAGEPEAVRLDVDKAKFDGNRDVIHCEIKIVDKDGAVVPVAQNEVTVTIEGAACLMGLDNSHPGDLTQMQSPVRKVFAGMALALIKSAQDKGEATVTVSSPGLEPAQVKLEIE